jgi:hypothetical protein
MRGKLLGKLEVFLAVDVRFDCPTTKIPLETIHWPVQFNKIPTMVQVELVRKLILPKELCTATAEIRISTLLQKKT